jgi:putative ABC transport system substrate-binding protein
LRELGYVEGRNIAIELRSAEGEVDRLPRLAAGLVEMKVDVMLASGTAVTQAIKQTATATPVVFVGVGDPVGTGFVGSLARPGGNLTGLASIGPELSGKRLELLKETLPTLSRVAVLWQPADPLNAAYLRETQAAARSLGVALQLLGVHAPDEFDRAFAAMTRERAQALMLLAGPLLNAHQRRLANLAVKARLPAMHSFRDFVDAGGLLSYAANLPDMFRRASTYVEKILKGAKPADLPVEQPTRFELVINLKTAKALGLTIPQSVLFRADQVIQ